MSMIFRLGLCLAIAITLSFATLAVAQSYRVRSNVSDGVQNMRAGPGTGHRIVVAIPAGSDGIEQVGGCLRPDDARSRYKWCEFSWRGHSGWISINGLEQVAGVQQTGVRPVDPLQLARAGIVWHIYDAVREAEGRGEFAGYEECPYQGEGWTISLSPSLAQSYKSRGFSLRAMCLALGSSDVKFDPKTGQPIRQYLLPGYDADAEWQFPYSIPDCFKEVDDGGNTGGETAWRPTGCQIKFHSKTGMPIQAGERVTLVTGGGAGEAPDESSTASAGSVSSSELGRLLQGD